MEQKSNVPNIAVEAAFSVLKWALIILVINNALWAAIHYGDTKRPSHNTEIKRYRGRYIVPADGDPYVILLNTPCDVAYAMSSAAVASTTGGE